MSEAVAVAHALHRLDTMAQEVTTWEAGFVESLLRQHRPLSPKQRAVLCRMCEQYLGADGVRLAAEIRGQQRFL